LLQEVNLGSAEVLRQAAGADWLICAADLLDDGTTCTAVAPDLVFTVLTYGTRQLHGPSLVRKFSSHEERNFRSAPIRIGSGQIVAQLRASTCSGTMLVQSVKLWQRSLRLGSRQEPRFVRK